MIMRVIVSFAFLITDNNIVMVIIMTLFFLVSPFINRCFGRLNYAFSNRFFRT